MAQCQYNHIDDSLYNNALVPYTFVLLLHLLTLFTTRPSHPLISCPFFPFTDTQWLYNPINYSLYNIHYFNLPLILLFHLVLARSIVVKPTSLRFWDNVRCTVVLIVNLVLIRIPTDSVHLTDSQLNLPLYCSRILR